MLNYTQQQILEAYLTMLLEDDDYLQLHPTNALHILQSVIDDQEFKNNRSLLKQLNMLDTCVQLRSVLRHECPQNVNQALDSHNGFVTYKDFNGHRKTEKQGLLGLTAKNDATAEPVTKRDVVKFITDCIEREINFHNRSLKRERMSKQIEKQVFGDSTSDSSSDSSGDLSDSPVTQNLWKALEGLNDFSYTSGELYRYYDKELIVSLTASQAANFQFALNDIKNKASEPKISLLLLQYANSFIQFYCMKEYEAKPWIDLIDQMLDFHDDIYKNCIDNLSILCRYHRGICYDHIGAHEEALDDFNKVLQKDAAFFIAYLQRAKCHYSLGKLKKTKMDLESCMLIFPSNAEAHYYMGLYHLKKKKYSRASEDFSKAIDLDDHDFRFYTARGECFFEQKEYNQALEDYDNAIRLNKSDAKTYLGRGWCYKNIGVFPKAIADLTSSIDLDPRNKDAYLARGSCYIAEEQYSKAITDWTVVVNLDPKDTSARYWRGICLYRSAIYDQALNDFAQVVHQDPLHAKAYNYLGCCHSLDHNYDEAIINFEAAINLDPSLARAYYNLARCYYNKGELDKTLELYNKSIRLDPVHANSFGGRAQVYDRLGDSAAAVKDIKQALMIDPKNEVFRRYKAKFESKAPKKGWFKKTVRSLNPLKRKVSNS